MSETPTEPSGRNTPTEGVDSGQAQSSDSLFQGGVFGTGVSVGPPLERDARGVWVSPDGTWEWDGTRWAPRGGAAARLGQLMGFSLKELEANRSGRLVLGQAIGLWFW